MRIVGFFIILIAYFLIFEGGDISLINLVGVWLLLVGAFLVMNKKEK